MTTHRKDCLSGAPCFCTLPDEVTGVEKDWLGPEDETKHIIFHMQSDAAEKRWLHAEESGLELEESGEFSIRIHHPKLKSLSFIFRTICIIPKSLLRDVYALIGHYLNDNDKN
jgi:hypothetical protein